MKRKFNIYADDSIFIEDEFRTELKGILSQLNLSDSLTKEGILKLPKGSIGRITTPELDITIKPNLWYLKSIDYLRLVDENGVISEEDDKLLSYINSDDILNYLVKKFDYYLKDLSLKGFPKRYKTYKKYSDFFTGNVELENTIIRNKLGINPSVSTIRNLLNTDYYELKVIKRAYSKLLNSNLVDREPVILRNFSYIKDGNIFDKQIRSYKPHFGRHENEMKATYELALMILDNMNLGRGFSEMSSSLIIDSISIMETFVFYILRKFVDEYLFHYHTETIPIAERENRGQITCTPDIIYKGVNKAVIDVKNKNYDKNFLTPDLYQLRTYCENFDSKIGILVYPYYQNSNPQRLSYYKDRSINLYAVGINITEVTHAGRMDSLNLFAENVKQILSFS